MNCRKCGSELQDFWTVEKVTDDIENALGQRDPTVIVAENNGNIVGFLWGYKKPEGEFDFLEDRIDDSSVYLDDVAVREDLRLKGIGKLLCQEFIDRNIDRTLFLRTQCTYPASNMLFKKVGFERTNVYDPKYQDREYFVRRPDSKSGPNLGDKND